MKKNIVFLLLMIVSANLFAQKLTSENLQGKWLVQFITLPDGMGYDTEQDTLFIPESKSHIKEENDSSTYNQIIGSFRMTRNLFFTFNQNGFYSVISENDSTKPQPMEAGKYTISQAKKIIFKADKKVSKGKNLKEAKANFKDSNLILHAPDDNNAITIFKMKKAKAKNDN